MNSTIISEYTSYCSFCEEENETFDHIFHDCPVFWEQRRQAGITSNQERWEPAQIRKMLQIKDVDKAMEGNITEELKC